jgi:hypothetical protein
VTDTELGIEPRQTWRHKQEDIFSRIWTITYTRNGEPEIVLDNGNVYTPNALLEYWELAEGGRKIILEYAPIDPQVKGARELTKAELEEARVNWGVWKARYGDKGTDQGLANLVLANRQLGRIKREQYRRKKLAGEKA